MSAPSDGHFYGGTLVIATKLEPTFYQTNYQWDGGVVYISHNILSKLCAWDEDTKSIYPDLAESWDIAEDLLTYTFHLREGVKWHDGEPFTSKDVKWTFDSILEHGDQAYTYRPPAPEDLVLTMRELERIRADVQFVTTENRTKEDIRQRLQYYRTLGIASEGADNPPPLTKAVGK